MKFRRAGIVRITPRDNAATAGTATAGRQVGIVKTHAAGGQSIRVRGLDRWMPVAAEIFLRYIIRDEEHDIRQACRLTGLPLRRGLCLQCLPDEKKGA